MRKRCGKDGLFPFHWRETAATDRSVPGDGKDNDGGGSTPSGGDRLSMLLFPQKNGIKREAPRGGTALCSFSAEEVREYSRSLGDHNSIHQTERPIVSGFQILEAVLRAYPAESAEMSFHYPVRSGETIYAVRQGETVQGYTDCLCFTVKTETAK